MTPLEALAVASDGFSHVLSQVDRDAWDQPSLNPGWSVRDLINHVVGGNRRYVLLLAGAPTAQVEALRDLNHLSADVARDFASTTSDVTAAFAAPGVLASVVHHRLGDRPATELLTMRIQEHALHGWDLAASVGASYHIPDGVVAHLLAVIDADPGYLLRCGFISLPTSPADSAERRLLLLTGRNPE